MSAPFVPRELEVHGKERLAQSVAGAVHARCGRSVAGLAVTVEHGVATLHGRVRSYYQKQVMLAAARSVPGVVVVIDGVEVTPLDEHQGSDRLSEPEMYGTT